jgi:hypothetical protein
VGVVGLIFGDELTAFAGLQRAVLRGEPRLQTGPRPLTYPCVIPIYPFTAEVKRDWKTLAEQLSYLHLPKPFKNPQYTKNINRRVKNLKTVLGQEREREKADRERRRQVPLDAGAQPPEETMEVDGETNRAKTVDEDKEAPTCMFSTTVDAVSCLSHRRHFDRSPSFPMASETVLRYHRT